MAPPPSQQAPASTPRERFRVQIRADAKAAALRQLAAGGLPAVSVNAIAKELGVSGPALYRYFASRDDLLDQLVVDAYGELADAIEAAAGAEQDEALDGYARAYRAWARAHPHRYRLLYGQPAAAHDGHRPELIAATERLMALLLAAVRAEGAATATVEPALGRQLRAWAADRGLTADGPEALRAITVWARLHGWARLEIDGNFASMGLDAALLPVGL